MAFAEADRANIRRWMGYPATYLTSAPALENAITVVQAIVDGGERADNSTELLIKGYLTQLGAIETQWLAYLEQMQAVSAEQVKVDPLRGIAGLKQLGRIYVGHVSDALGIRPLRDVFVMPIPVTC